MTTTAKSLVNLALMDEHAHKHIRALRPGGERVEKRAMRTRPKEKKAN